MAGFENYGADTGEIELEIERKGIVLGVDWSDEVQVRALAREALDHLQQYITLATYGQLNYQLLVKVDLFGLVRIMLTTMEESASIGIMSHGGGAWKAFAKALWAEKELRNSAGTTT